MVAFEDSSIASVAPMYVNEVTLPQLRILGLPFCSVVERRLVTGKEERWPSGWRVVVSLYRRMIVYAEQDGVRFMQVTHQ